MKVHKRVYDSTLGGGVIKKKKKNPQRVTLNAPGTGFHFHSW